MNPPIVRRLIAKDWYLLRWTVFGYVAGGLISVFLLATGGEAMFNAGGILTITVLIALGMHVVTATVVGERIEHTMPFVMSLPVSIAQYTFAKIVANALIFFGAWLVITLGVSGVVLFRASVPHGLIVVSTIMLLYLLTSYSVVLATAISTESMGWTIGAVVVGNILLNVLMYGLGHIPSIQSTYASNEIVWSSSAVNVLLGECSVILAAIALTFFVQARKSEFL
jgi:hypothetical protein